MVKAATLVITLPIAVLQQLTGLTDALSGHGLDVGLVSLDL